MRVARLELERAAPHLTTRPQAHGQPAGGVGELLQPDRGAGGIHADGIGAGGADGYVRGLHHRHTPRVEHLHLGRRDRMPVRDEGQPARADGELGRQARHVHGDRVPALDAPRILHGDAQPMRARRERDRDKVVHAVDSHAPGVDRLGAVVQHHRRIGLALHADVDAIGRQHRPVLRREDVDARTRDESGRLEPRRVPRHPARTRYGHPWHGRRKDGRRRDGRRRCGVADPRQWQRLGHDLDHLATARGVGRCDAAHCQRDAARLP